MQIILLKDHHIFFNVYLNNISDNIYFCFYIFLPLIVLMHKISVIFYNTHIYCLLCKFKCFSYKNFVCTHFKVSQLNVKQKNKQANGNLNLFLCLRKKIRIAVLELFDGQLMLQGKINNKIYIFHWIIFFSVYVIIII